MDYLTAVRQAYKIDSEEVLSEEISISKKKLKWGNIKERGYDAVVRRRASHSCVCFHLDFAAQSSFSSVAW